MLTGSFWRRNFAAGTRRRRTFFVHANYESHRPLSEQPEEMLYWEKFNDPPPHQSGKIMVCGHTPQKSGIPRNIGHAICIDTWAYGNGWLTCLDVGSGKYWQANQRRETRGGQLPEADQSDLDGAGIFELSRSSQRLPTA